MGMTTRNLKLLLYLIGFIFISIILIELSIRFIYLLTFLPNDLLIESTYFIFGEILFIVLILSTCFILYELDVYVLNKIHKLKPISLGLYLIAKRNKNINNLHGVK